MDNVAYRQMTPGDPESLIQVTEPLRQVGPGDVLVRIRATALNARDLSVYQGKGLDLAAAKASGIMEAAESYHAEHVGHPLKLASYAELRTRHVVADADCLPRYERSVFHEHLPLL